MRLAAALAVILLAATPARADVKPDQWIYREVDGWPGPVASFLSWNYDTVLFQAYCEGDMLVLSYPGESEVETDPGQASSPLALEFADGVGLTLDTERKDGVRVGRIKLTPGVKQAILAASTINIEAGLDMGDPWFTGEAEPFKRLVRGCVA